MEKYPLQALLQVRIFRENEAQQRLAKAKKDKHEAQQVYLEAKQALQDYIQWRIAEEKARYDEIMGTVCSKQDLDNVRLELDQLKIKEIALQQNIDIAHTKMLNCEEALQQAQEVFCQMRKEKEKLMAHKDSWNENALKEEIYFEERESEDLHLTIKP